jgi:predicted metal-binding membrane protein
MLGAVTGVAWSSMVAASHRMSAMTYGLAQVGSAMPFSSSVTGFFGMWITMMAAMMLPSVGPSVSRHQIGAPPARSAAVGTIAFASSYLAVWTLSGMVALAGLVALRHVTPDVAAIDRVGGAVFVVAGIYQLTRWKHAFLHRCRTLTDGQRPGAERQGVAGAVRAGASHGLSCLGCCWALMVALFAVGLMDLAWMGAVAVIFVAEKNWAHGARLARVVGVALGALGIAVLVHPAGLTTVAGVHHRMMSG